MRTRILVLAALFWLAGSLPTIAQTLLPPHIVSTSDTDCLPDTSCATVFDLRDVDSIGTYIDIGVSGTANFEATIDETTWFTVADDVNSASTQTTDGARFFTNPGYRQFRVRFSAISGNATVTIVKGPSNLRSTATLSGASGDGTVLDGANPLIKGTVLDLASSNPLTVAITDAAGAQITSFGGGTQYAEAATAATITGTAIMFESNTGTNALSVVNNTTPLPVSDAGGSLTVDGTVAVSNVVSVSDNSGSLTVDYATTGSGTATGALRVELPTNGTGVIATVSAVTAITNALPAGDNDIGNVDLEFAGTAASTGVGASGAQTLRTASLIHDGTNTASVRDTGATDSLNVAITDASGNQITSFGGGTQFAEDIASANADVGTLAMARRTATPANTSGTDGDYETLQMSAGRLWASTILTDGTDTALIDGSGNLSVTCANCSGTGVSVNEDVASADANPGTPAYTVRNDTVTGATSTDGDYQPMKSDSAGRVYTTGTGGTFPSTQSGTWTVQPGNTANTTAWLVTGTGGTFPVTDSGGSLTVDYATTGSGTATGALRVELPTNGTGVIATVGAVTAITNALPTGSNTIGALTANQSVNVAQINGVTTLMGNGATGTGSQRVTLANDNTIPTGWPTAANQSSEVTALQLIDNLPNTIGSTTSGQSGALIFGAVTTSAPTYTTAQSHPLSLDTTGALRVVGSAGTTQYVEDAAATDGASLVAVGVIRRDTTPSSSAGTAGDNAMLNADANGRLYTNTTLYDAAGAAITVATDVTEDAAETAGGTGPMVMNVRRDTAASSAGTTGDNATFNSDALGKLWTTGSYAEDAAHTSADTGVFIMAVRNDAGTALAGTTGDYIPLSTDSSGALRVVGSSGTTQFAEDIAHTTGDATVFIAGIRRDTTPSSSAGTAGDYTAFNIDANGRVYVNSTLYDAAGAAIDLATAAVEDAAETAGGSGPMVLSVRRDTAASSAGTTGDNATFNTDSIGRLWTSGANLEDVASANADQGLVVFAIRDDTLDARSGTEGDYEMFHLNANGALWAIDVNSAALLTSNQLQDDVVGVEDAAETAGTGLAMAGTVRRDTPASSAGTTGDNATLNTNAVGALYVAPAGALAHYRTAAGTTEDEHEIKATAGILYSVLITNTNAAARYIRCYNLTAANTTPGTSTVFWGAAIPGATTGAGFAYTFPAGLTFDTALTCAWTTGAADTDVAEVAANEIKATYSYR